MTEYKPFPFIIIHALLLSSLFLSEKFFKNHNCKIFGYMQLHIQTFFG